MTSPHDSLIADTALAAVFEVHGESLTYTPKGGSGVAFTGVLGEEQATWIEQAGRRVKRRQRSVTLSTDADGDYAGVASPALKAQVTAGGEEWNIESAAPLAGSFVRLVIVRLEYEGRSSPSYAGR